MTEIWKDIVGYEGLYQISNGGRVKRLSGKPAGEYRFSNEHILKAHSQKNSRNCYYKITLCKKCEKKKFYIHRLVSIHFIPNPENKPEVNHKDGIKTNNWDWNLEWATVGENAEHAYSIGLKKFIPLYGEEGRNVKLTNADVEQIKIDLKNGILGKELAKEYSISNSQISNIKLGKSRVYDRL